MAIQRVLFTVRACLRPPEPFLLLDQRFPRGWLFRPRKGVWLVIPWGRRIDAISTRGEGTMGEARQVMDRVTAAVSGGNLEDARSLYADDATAVTPDQGKLKRRRRDRRLSGPVRPGPFRI